MVIILSHSPLRNPCVKHLNPFGSIIELHYMAHTVITCPTLRLPQQVILQCFAVIFNKLLPSSVYSLSTLELKKLFPLVKLMCHAYHRSNMEKDYVCMTFTVIISSFYIVVTVQVS